MGVALLSISADSNKFSVYFANGSSVNTSTYAIPTGEWVHLALTKSGTINMELALNGVPQIVGYKVSRITSFLARKILRFKVDHISPVNLLLKRRLLTELVQKEFTPESIFRYARHAWNL